MTTKKNILCLLLLTAFLSAVSFSQTNKSASAWFKSGRQKASLRDYRGAVEDYTKAVELKPDDPRFYDQRGVAKHHLKDYEGAIDDFSRAIELNPNDAKAYNERGITYLTFNRKSRIRTEVLKRKARADFMKAMELGFKVDQKYLDECN
jgi:Flp pilus assembly protein TadD